MALTVGTRLGHYDVTALIREGGTDTCGTPPTPGSAARRFQMNERCLGAVLTMMTVVFLPLPFPTSGQIQAQAQTATANAWTPPRTPDGQPDLQGVWLNNSATPLERPQVLEGRRFLTDEEVTELKQRADRIFKAGDSDFAGGDNVFLAAFANLDQYTNPNSTSGSVEMIEREFDNRTSMIVDPPDGQIPRLTPDAQQRQAGAAAARQEPPAGPEYLSSWVRCITRGLPRLGAGIYSYYQILQTPGYMVLMMETIHDARIIPLDGRGHLGATVRQWLGDSRGRWEGDTLVVETANFSPTSNFRGSGENLRLVERFTRLGPDTLEHQIAIDDPTTWSTAWTAELRLTQTQHPIYEFACHEGNHRAMRGILAGARLEDEAKTAEEAAKGSR